MNKKELVEAISKETGLTKADSEKAVNAFMKNVVKAVKKEPVQLVGFGTFKVAKRKARKGVNPQTGKEIKIPARKAFVFKASKGVQL